MDLFLSLVGTGNLFFVCVCVSLLYDTLRLENCIKIRKKKKEGFFSKALPYVFPGGNTTGCSKARIVEGPCCAWLLESIWCNNIPALTVNFPSCLVWQI